MRGDNKSLLNRYWQESELRSGRSEILLPILVPIIVMKIILIGIVGTVIYKLAEAYPSALYDVLHEVHAAKKGVATDQKRTQLKGGGFRQAGYQQKGSLIRPGGSLNSDDLRRRLDELRSTDPGGPGRRALNRGGQHGQ